MQLLQPHPGWVELDPHVLWEQFVDIITEVIEGTQTSQSINQSTSNNSIHSFPHYERFILQYLKYLNWLNLISWVSKVIVNYGNVFIYRTYPFTVHCS